MASSFFLFTSYVILTVCDKMNSTLISFTIFRKIVIPNGIFLPFFATFICCIGWCAIANIIAVSVIIYDASGAMIIVIVQWFRIVFCLDLMGGRRRWILAIELNDRLNSDRTNVDNCRYCIAWLYTAATITTSWIRVIFTGFVRYDRRSIRIIIKSWVLLFISIMLVIYTNLSQNCFLQVWENIYQFS